jgi:hypothetical protein
MKQPKELRTTQKSGSMKTGPGKVIQKQRKNKKNVLKCLMNIEAIKEQEELEKQGPHKQPGHHNPVLRNLINVDKWEHDYTSTCE